MKGLRKFGIAALVVMGSLYGMSLTAITGDQFVNLSLAVLALFSVANGAEKGE